LAADSRRYDGAMSAPSGSAVDSGEELLAAVDRGGSREKERQNVGDAVTVVLRPTRGLSIDFRELWSYRELFYFLVWRDLKVRYKQTVLGIAWAVIQPLMAMVIFSVIFGNFAKISSQGLPYPVFVFSGLLAWNYFSQAMNLCSQSLAANTNLVTKVYAPRLLLPLAASTIPLADFAMSFAMLLGIMAWYDIAPGIGILLLPAFLLFAYLTAGGVGVWVAAVTARYRDARYALPFVTQIWMYTSPVIYPATLVPNKYQWILSLNPMTGVIGGFRWALVGAPAPSAVVLAVSGVSASLVAALGLLYFGRVERGFADVI
jgi:homopolymeric O-antigen transport system permease protein